MTAMSDLAGLVYFLFTYALFKMLTTLLKHTMQNGGQGQVMSSILKKVTGKMSSVLMTLETNDINRVSRARSHTDGVFWDQFLNTTKRFKN